MKNVNAYATHAPEKDLEPFQIDRREPGPKDVEIEIFEGVDGKDLFPDIEYIYYFPKPFFEENNLDYDRCAKWNKGQLGCAMSNFLVQREILRRNLKNA